MYTKNESGSAWTNVWMKEYIGYWQILRLQRLNYPLKDQSKKKISTQQNSIWSRKPILNGGRGQSEAALLANRHITEQTNFSPMQFWNRENREKLSRCSVFLSTAPSSPTLCCAGSAPSRPAPRRSLLAPPPDTPPLPRTLGLLSSAACARSAGSAGAEVSAAACRVGWLAWLRASWPDSRPACRVRQKRPSSGEWSLARAGPSRPRVAIAAGPSPPFVAGESRYRVCEIPATGLAASKQ